MSDVFDLRELQTDDGPLVERLFGAKGACGGCWCMYYRREKHGAAWDACKGEINRRDFLDLIGEGQMQAILAMKEEEPVGWCCFGPKLSFAKLAKSRTLRRPGDEAAWAIVCLYLPAKTRRQGLGGRLVQAATQAALRQGAREVEGYPKETFAGKTQGAAFIWNGTVGQFQRAGFKALRRPAGLRAIYLYKA